MLTLISSSVLALSLAVAGQSEPEPFLEDLAELRLDRNQIYRIRDLTIRRDVISVAFSRGVIAFLEPVEGRVTGAVFLGSGDVLAIPPDAVERSQIYRFTGSPILNERFNAAILRFTDDTFAEIVELTRRRAFEEVRADDLEALLPWEENVGERSHLLNHRILADLLGSTERPLFFAGLRGERVGWFGVTYDGRTAEEIVIGRMGDTARPVPDLWASFNRRSEARDPESFAHEDPSDMDVLSYQIDTTIATDGRISATARARIRVQRSGERVLTFGLTQSLRLSAVTVDGVQVSFSQYPVSVVGGSRDPRAHQFALVLPRPTRRGEELVVEFRYAGEVLESRGYGIYHLRDRGRWYPNLGPKDAALYELDFHYPSGTTLVATGDRVVERDENGVRHSSWTSGRELFVAGFNYGDFSVESDESGRVPIHVYANNSVEEGYRALEDWAALQTEQAWRSIRPRFRFSRRRPTVDVEPDYELFSTRRLARNVLLATGSALEFFSDQFGPYPFERLGVSQAPVGLSQGWPTLLYASTMSFFGSDQLERLGFTTLTDFIHPEYQRAHEIAHQWFGNKVGWRSYRDQWMVEGLSNYASLMYLEHAYGSTEPLDALMEELSLRLLTETAGGRTQNDNGPIWLGERLSSSDAPDGYQETVYTKATWVIHMLRMLMRDQVTGSDDRFFRMISAFLEEFDGRLASTWDLKRVAEQHMTDRMDLTGRGDLDWFFDQWVFDARLPQYTLEFSTEATGTGFVLSGRINQTADWSGIVPVPVYAVTTEGSTLFLGNVVVEEDSADFSYSIDRRPVELLLDPYSTVLKRQ